MALASTLRHSTCGVLYGSPSRRQTGSPVTLPTKPISVRGGPAPAAEPLTLARIQHYVWRRYVEFAPAPFALDEEAALAFLEAHHREHPLAGDAECFYYGILAYERSFGGGRAARARLERALEAFTAYRAQTSSDFRWDPVEDRYHDALRELEAELTTGAAREEVRHASQVRG